MKSIKKIFKGIVLITSSIIIVLNFILLVKLLSLEKMIKLNKISYRRRLPLLYLKESEINLSLSELGEKYDWKFFRFDKEER